MYLPYFNNHPNETLLCERRDSSDHLTTSSKISVSVERIDEED